MYKYVTACTYKDHITFRGVVAREGIHKSSVAILAVRRMYALRGNVTAGARGGGNLSTPVPIAGPEPASEDGAEGAGGVLCKFKEGG